MTEKWNAVYSTRSGGMWSPDEGIVRFISRYLKRRVGIDVWDEKRKVNHVLDAGCGHGRHIVLLAEQGFDVHGIDISEEAIQIGKAWLVKKGLKADLQVGDLKRLPFANEYFDVVISFGVLDHITLSEAKSALREIKRVSSKGAYLYITLRSTEDSEYGRGQITGKNTFILQEGYEKGIMQHFFDLNEIRELLDGFRIFDIECHERKFPEIFTVDKGFIQSSKGTKKYIDLSKPMDLNLKYSRWHIAAEKV